MAIKNFRTSFTVIFKDDFESAHRLCRRHGHRAMGLCRLKLWKVVDGALHRRVEQGQAFADLVLEDLRILL